MKQPESEESLYFAACRLMDEAERAAFLDAQCQGDSQKRRRLNALLAAQGNAEAFFAQPPPGLAASPTAHPSKGRRFGDYELLEEIARGGMGIVYKARQLSLGRFVAVKMLLFGSRASPEFIERFHVEASAAAALQHPNIVAIHEVGVEQGEHFLVMDYVDGPNLAKLVKEQSLPAERAATYVKAIAEAIHFAHEKGILHRDLKPSNVLIDANDQPRVTDFGLAKRFGDSQPSTKDQLTLSGQVIGSPGYMPPEQASGVRGKMSRRSDVYSLGAMLYHLLTGRAPFGGGSVAETLRQVETQEAVSLRAINPGVPLDLETICLKCLEKDPDGRYHTAKDLGEELGRFLNDEVINARPISRPERARRWVQRNRVLTALVAALATASLLAAWKSFDWWQTKRLRIHVALALERKWDDLVRGLITCVTLTSADLAAATGKGGTLNPRAQRLKVGLYVEADQWLTTKQMAPFLQKIEEGMSRRLASPVQIDLYMYLKREEMEGALQKGLIDVVRIGEGPLVRSRRQNPAIMPLVQQVGGGKTSAVFVATSSPITNLAGLRGAKFAAGNPTSTSTGYKLLEQLLIAGLHSGDLDIEPQMNSDENPEFVASGQFDAGVARKDKLHGSLTKSLRILTEFPTTTMPWAGRAKLNPDLSRAFTEALVAVKDQPILRNLPDDATQGFKPADPVYFRHLDDEMRRVEKEFYEHGGPQ